MNKATIPVCSFTFSSMTGEGWSQVRTEQGQPQRWRQTRRRTVNLRRLPTCPSAHPQAHLNGVGSAQTPADPPVQLKNPQCGWGGANPQHHRTEPPHMRGRSTYSTSPQARGLSLAVPTTLSAANSLMQQMTELRLWGREWCEPKGLPHGNRSVHRRGAAGRWAPSMCGDSITHGKP